MTATRGNSGFTLVEAIVSLTLGILLVGAMLSVLMGNNSLSTSLTGRAEANDAMMTGIALLERELAPIDASDGDLASLSTDTLGVRAFLASGTACGVSYTGSSATVVLRKQGRWMSAGDSILLLADNDVSIGGDDTWVRGSVTAVDTTQACPDGVVAQQLTIPALAGLTDSVRVGAAARTFEWRRYFLAQIDGSWYLAIRTPALSQPEPVAGPLADPAVERGGFRVQHYDAFGNPATDVLTVTQSEISLKTIPHVGSRAAMADSLVAWVRHR